MIPRREIRGENTSGKKPDEAFVCDWPAKRAAPLCPLEDICNVAALEIALQQLWQDCDPLLISRDHYVAAEPFSKSHYRFNQRAGFFNMDLNHLLK